MCRRFGRSLWIAGSLAAIGSLLGVMVALAASGGLDTTFSGDGKQTTDISGNWNDSADAIAIQADGKIVAAGNRHDPANPWATTGNFAVARYNTNGVLDSTFSGDGKQLTDFGGNDQALGVAIQSDGKIVVSGMKCNGAQPCDLAVARYKTDGTLDSTFSGDGKQVVAYGANDNASLGGLAIQSDGKIVIAGYMVNSNGNFDFAVYRLNPNGTLDSTFSGDGRQHFGFGVGRHDLAWDLVLSGGKIVVVGQSCDSHFAGCNFAVARLTSSGALDSTFSGDGRLMTDFGATEYAYSVAMQPDGKIVAAGTKSLASSNVVAVARYNANGTLDATFSGDGRQTVAIGTYARAKDVLVQSNGKIVLAGFGGSSDFALARLNPNGSLDTTFSGDGKATVDFGGFYSDAYALARQSDGKYVVGGYASDGTSNNFALARVLP